jgi:inorganic pyrophosphatase
MIMTLPSAFNGKKELLSIVIETPKGSRNKYAYDEETGMYRLKKVLPSGMSFPYDFGFVPYTRADDGDPLDVLVIMDAPTFPGCIVDCLLLGVMKIEQEKDKKMVRNDRLLARHVESREHKSLRQLGDLSPSLLREIMLFFENYTRSDGSRFNHLGNENSAAAIKLVKASMTK